MQSVSYPIAGNYRWGDGATCMVDLASFLGVWSRINAAVRLTGAFRKSDTVATDLLFKLELAAVEEHQAGFHCIRIIKLAPVL